MPMANRPVDQNRSGARPLEARIRKSYAELPSSERRIADLILEFPGDVGAYSATELAKLANSSKAAVTRLTRRLGYSNFDEARRSARDAREWGSPLYMLSHQADAPTPTGPQLKDHLKSDFANMARTFDDLDSAQIDEIVEAIVKARRVWLVGYRNSHFLASYARQQFVQVRDNVTILPLGGETLAEYMASMSGDDVLVVIGFRRRVPSLRRIMETAADLEIPMVYLTDPTVRETASLARWTLIVNVAGSDVFDSYSAALSLIHYISTAVVSKAGARGRKRLKRIEALHDRIGEFGE